MKNQIFGLKHDFSSGIPELKGRIYGTSPDSFTLQKINGKELYELYVRSGYPSNPRSYYTICEGTYDYCLGVLHGRYDHSSQSVNQIRFEITYRRENGQKQDSLRT